VRGSTGWGGFAPDCLGRKEATGDEKRRRQGWREKMANRQLGNTGKHEQWRLENEDQSLEGVKDKQNRFPSRRGAPAARVEREGRQSGGRAGRREIEQCRE